MSFCHGVCQNSLPKFQIIGCESVSGWSGFPYHNPIQFECSAVSDKMTEETFEGFRVTACVLCRST